MLANAVANLRALHPDRPPTMMSKAVRRYAAPMGGGPGSYDFLPGPGCGQNNVDSADRGCRLHGLIRLVPSPHCGPGRWASVDVGVPEVARSLICPDRRRSPDLASGVYPAGYLALSASAVADDIARRLPDVLARQPGRG
jgi:hypothetical protein